MKYICLNDSLNLIVEEKLNIKNQTVFFLKSTQSIWPTRRLRKDHVENALKIGMYLPINDKLFNMASSVNITKEHLKVSFTEDSSIFTEDRKEKNIANPCGYVTFFVDLKFFNEEEINYLKTKIKRIVNEEKIS